MSSIANALSSNAASSSGSSSANSSAQSSTDPLANESTFLTLLVSQLQNQDPLDPTDSNQFITQLTGYSQLEQLIGIHGDTDTLAGDASSSASATATNSSSNPTSGS